MEGLPFRCWLSPPIGGSQNTSCYFICSFHCIWCFLFLLSSLLSFCHLLFTCYLERATQGFKIDLILHWGSGQLSSIQRCLFFSPSLTWQLYPHSSSHPSFLFSSWHFSVSAFLVHLFVYCLMSTLINKETPWDRGLDVLFTAVFSGSCIKPAK